MVIFDADTFLKLHKMLSMATHGLSLALSRQMVFLCIKFLRRIVRHNIYTEVNKNSSYEGTAVTKQYQVMNRCCVYVYFKREEFNVNVL